MISLQSIGKLHIECHFYGIRWAPQHGLHWGPVLKSWCQLVASVRFLLVCGIRFTWTDISAERALHNEKCVQKSHAHKRIVTDGLQIDFIIWNVARINVTETGNWWYFLACGGCTGDRIEWHFRCVCVCALHKYNFIDIFFSLFFHSRTVLKMNRYIFSTHMDEHEHHMRGGGKRQPLEKTYYIVRAE